MAIPKVTTAESSNTSHGRSKVDYVSSDHIEAWVRSGHASLVGAEVCTGFHDWLLCLPWLPTSVDWSRLDHAIVDCSALSDEEIVDEVSKYPISEHSHLLVMYTPNQPGLICKFSDGIANLDLLYWKAPGVRYFCGIDIGVGARTPCYPHFAEFDGHAKIRIYTAKETSQ